MAQGFMLESEAEQIRRDYWLGRLPANESDKLETETSASDFQTELLLITRADLIREFLTNALEAGDKLLFEKNFLNVPTNRRDVFLAQAYRETIEREKVENFLTPVTASAAVAAPQGFWQGIFAPRLAFAAVALLIAFAGIVFWQLNEKSDTELAQTNVNAAQTSPAPLNVPTPFVPNVTPEVSPKKTNVNNLQPTPEKSATPKIENSPKPQSINLIKVLAFAGVRDDGENKSSVKLSKTNTILRLKILMPGLTELFDNYSATVVSAADNKIVHQIKLPNLNNLTTKAEIIVDTPAAKLAAGEFKVLLTGERADKTGKTLRELSFIVSRD